MGRISKGQLEKLQKKYKSDNAIAELFGVSRQTIYQLRTKYGIQPVMDKNLDRDSDILKLYESGIPGTKIAKKHNLSVSQTYRIIKNSTITSSLEKSVSLSGTTKLQ